MIKKMQLSHYAFSKKTDNCGKELKGHNTVPRTSAPLSKSNLKGGIYHFLRGVCRSHVPFLSELICLVETSVWYNY